MIFLVINNSKNVSLVILYNSNFILINIIIISIVNDKIAIVLFQLLFKKLFNIYSIHIGIIYNTHYKISP